LVVPWFRQLVAQRRISLATRKLGFVAEKLALGQVSYEYILFHLSASWHQRFTFVLHLSSKQNNFSSSKVSASFWGFSPPLCQIICCCCLLLLILSSLFFVVLIFLLFWSHYFNCNILLCETKHIGNGSNAFVIGQKSTLHNYLFRAS